MELLFEYFMSDMQDISQGFCIR